MFLSRFTLLSNLLKMIFKKGIKLEIFNGCFLIYKNRNFNDKKLDFVYKIFKNQILILIEKIYNDHGGEIGNRRRRTSGFKRILSFEISCHNSYKFIHNHHSRTYNWYICYWIVEELMSITIERSSNR